MIHKYSGLQVPFWNENLDREKVNHEYIKSDFALGLSKEDPALEKAFVEIFHRIDNSKDVFLYSDYPEEDLELGGGSDLVQLVFDTSAQIGYDVVITLLADQVILQGKVIFDNLKLFLLQATKEKRQRIAIKLKTGYGLEATYRLPKHLNPIQIETAVESIEKDCDGGKTVQQKIFTTMTFDTKTEKFEQD